MLIDIILSLKGRIYLFLRYRNKAHRLKVLDTKYEGSYSNAARILALDAFIVLFSILLIGFIGVSLFRGVLDLFS